ncbi:MAG: OB-fold nucleic acid binding domain-containing protein [Rickettsiales bacterium]|nr:OB-fold nucleic acid binding domain-containing protein [Rickettsiales bacterium]
MIRTTLATIFVTTVLAAPVYADESLGQKADKAMHQVKDAVAGVTIDSIGEKGAVTVSGEVIALDSIDNEFTLKDETGEIDVELNHDLTVTLGDKVTVSGVITSDMGEKEIAASKVTVTEQGVDEEKVSQYSY